MRCPACGGLTAVLETRLAGGGSVVRRRRSCGCGKRFSTRETVVDEVKSEAALPPVVPVTPEDVTPRVERVRPVVRHDFNAFDDDACFIPEC